MARTPMAPDAALSLDTGDSDAGKTGVTLLFFKADHYFCWDVTRDAIVEGYPRKISLDWPGLLEAAPGKRLRGALHVAAWGPIVFFLFEGDRRAFAWDMKTKLVVSTMPIQDLLPSRLTQGDFTPVLAKTPGHEDVVYAFSGAEYTRWAVHSSFPGKEDEGFPRRIEPDWKDGLVLAPRSGLYVDWPSRSPAHSNRKLYFFMGDLYLRWDVPSHSRNYRLDIASGWKGWPAMSLEA